MARSFTLAQIRTAVLGLCDAENDGNLVTAWLNTAISSSYSELVDLLVSSGLFYFRSTATLSYSAVTGLAALPADFLATVSVWYEKDASRRLPLRAVSIRDAWKFKKTSVSRAFCFETVGTNIQLYPPPPSGQTYTLIYVPCAADLTSDGQTVDGVQGFEELIVVDAAIKVGIRQETDVQVLLGRKQELLGRIQQMSQNREIASATSLYEEPEENYFDLEYGGFWY